MWLNAIGVLFQIAGTVLLASGLAGPGRIERWQSSIRMYLDARHTMPVITYRLRPIIPISFSILYKPLVVVFSAVWSLSAFLMFAIMCWWTVSGHAVQQIYELSAKYHDDPSPPAWIYGRGCVTYIMASIVGLEAALWIRFIIGTTFLTFLLLAIVIFFFNIGLRAVIRLLFYEIGEGGGKATANRLSHIVYGTLLVPTMTSYIITLVLLAPYLLAERISIRFQLRPALSVFGTIITIVGQVLQLIAVRSSS